ncbi:hypothetical protein ACZ87_00526 [Candidatus Erwinia dacicola]|uniref:Uncharacterized protein n=1 Tax=Candidatus Erwinia dacicola TaxID=252393 RepID=A0A328TQB3_9GAMM|nr:hypothetical protein ACZ87_00526 [Candidatus Erwinia dacicola]
MAGVKSLSLDEETSGEAISYPVHDHQHQKWRHLDTASLPL